MRIFGLDITRSKVSNTQTKAPDQLSPVDNRRAWHRIWEPFTGAWQRNLEHEEQDVLSNWAVFACMTLIAGDIAKMRVKLTERHGEGPGTYWQETEAAAFSPVLRKPNDFQTRQQFLEYWMLSKLSSGNTYVIKQRDERQVVTGLYVLDPKRVTPLVTPSGDVYYRLMRDDLSRVSEDNVVVPDTEIIHDRMNPLFHPLVGLSPIFANALAAMQGLRIQKNSEEFFANSSQPGGILTAPEEISDETALRLKEHFEDNYTGSNAGRIAVLGDGLKYEAMGVNANDSQLIDQLKWTAEPICASFHVPLYMIGVGQLPSYQNVEALSQQYYNQCLHKHIEAVEATLSIGLRLPSHYAVALDLRGLLRMDTQSRYKTLSEAVGGGWMSPDEARVSEDMSPVEGGHTPYMQKQNHALSELAKQTIQNEQNAVALPNGDNTDNTDNTDDDDEDEQEKRLQMDAFMARVKTGLDGIKINARD